MSGEHTEPNVSSQEKVVERIKWSELSDGEKKKIRTEVLEAILNGEISKVKALIRKYNGLKLAYYNYDGFKVQECMQNNEEGDNPLHLAAFHGHLQIVKYLIEQDYCERECRNELRLLLSIELQYKDNWRLLGTSLRNATVIQCVCLIGVELLCITHVDIANLRLSNI